MNASRPTGFSGLPLAYKLVKCQYSHDFPNLLVCGSGRGQTMYKKASVDIRYL